MRGLTLASYGAAILDRLPKRPALSADEERCLHRRMRAGDTTARNQLVERWLPLSIREAARHPRATNEEIVVDAAIDALFQCAETWDPDRGRFATPLDVAARRSVVRRVQRDRRCGIRLAPTDFGGPASLEGTGTRDEGDELGRLLSDRREPPPDAYDDVADPGLIDQALAAVRDRDREYLRRHLIDDEPLAGIGRADGCSHQRCSQVVERGKGTFAAALGRLTRDPAPPIRLAVVRLAVTTTRRSHRATGPPSSRAIAVRSRIREALRRYSGPPGPVTLALALLDGDDLLRDLLADPCTTADGFDARPLRRVVVRLSTFGEPLARQILAEPSDAPSQPPTLHLVEPEGSELAALWRDSVRRSRDASERPHTPARSVGTARPRQRSNRPTSSRRAA